MRRDHIVDKWTNRDRKRLKKKVAKKLDGWHKEKGKAKDSDEKKKNAVFRKNLTALGEELTDMLNN